MHVDEQILQRGIEEVLHFTTSNGMLGILSTGRLLAHSLLPEEKLLSHILQINCKDRSRDTEWHSYINLSISRLNGSFFNISQGWHRTEDIYWCVLSFSPNIMEHQGVLFSTSNNAYPKTERAPDGAGLDALFAPSVRQFPTKWVYRNKTLPECHTTCHQAEVLYPQELSLVHLRKVYVSTVEHQDEVSALIALLRPEFQLEIQVIVAPQLF